MLSTRKKITLLCVMIIGLFLLKTEYTDADLTAERAVSHKYKVSTLQIGQLHTANNKKINTLFRTYDIVPDGFDVGSVRIKKDGQLDFKYHIKTEILSQDATLCNGLSIEILKGRTQQYKGSLNTVSVFSEINNNKKEDFIFFVSLESNNANLKNKQCDFNIVFKTYRTNPEEKKGLWSETKLNNIVTSGNW